MPRGLPRGSLLGVDQGPPNAVVDLGSPSHSGTTPVVANITTTVDNCILINNIGGGYERTWTHDASQTEIWSEIMVSSDHVGTMVNAATAGNYTLTSTP